jgi:hypothetical protein
MPLGKLTSIFSVSACLLAAMSHFAYAEPNSVGYAVYFDSDVRDADECSMSVENGKIVIDSKVTNPALNCPDMFSWKLFIDVVRDRWWSNWASDTQTWPAEPYELCKPGAQPSTCCQPGATTNPGYGDVTTNPDYPNSMHCPFFPGEQPLAALAAAPPRRLGKPIGAHAISLGGGGLPGALNVPFFARPGEPEPGRVIRQQVGEITVRNKEMFDYIFKNNLYNQQGVIDVFNRNSDNLTKNAPYQATNVSGSLSKIDLPIAAIMIKSNWLYEEFARDMGLVDDPSAPYVKKVMTTTVGDKTYTGIHWLIAFHISTKDVPQWVWATFEHVNNPGRCDFTGCNDSYGYASDDARPDAMHTKANFTAPHVRNDGLGTSSNIYNLGLRYTSGPVTPELANVFGAISVGTSGATSSEEPSPADGAWRSYRLKGSQVNFTNTMGRATRLGNSITEGGFMMTSSCISCHARASVSPSGDSKRPMGVPLGVFLYDRLSEVGYTQSAEGVPQKDWYHGSASRPALKALQTDFIWGMPFFANPLSAEK